MEILTKKVWNVCLFRLCNTKPVYWSSTQTTNFADKAVRKQQHVDTKNLNPSLSAFFTEKIQFFSLNLSFRHSQVLPKRQNSGVNSSFRDFIWEWKELYLTICKDHVPFLSIFYIQKGNTLVSSDCTKNIHHRIERAQDWLQMIRLGVYKNK